MVKNALSLNAKSVALHSTLKIDFYEPSNIFVPIASKLCSPGKRETK
jgi:hypothetical protein